MFIPTPPSGVVRCAASPVSNTRRSRNAVESSAPMVQDLMLMISTSRSSTPDALPVVLDATVLGEVLDAPRPGRG